MPGLITARREIPQGDLKPFHYDEYYENVVMFLILIRTIKSMMLSCHRSFRDVIN